MSVISGIKARFNKLTGSQRMAAVGVAAVVAIYLGSAGLISVTMPWFSTHGDTIPHVDYVWRLYNGDIPKYTDGITYGPFLDQGGAKETQQAAANPPLFYMIHAPIVGPLLDKGYWEEGIALGRAINLFIGVLCILALAWAGWVFGGKRKELFTVAVPALGVTTYWFVRQNQDYALDGLVVLLATLAFINMYKLLVHGPQTKYLVSIMLLSVAGMLTKASYIVILAVSLLAVLVAYNIGDKKIRRENVIKGTYVSALIGVVALIAVGWFYYYWNYKISGAWFRPFTDETLLTSRPHKSLMDVFSSPLLYALMYARYAAIPVISTAIISFALAGVLSMKNLSWERLKKNRVLLWAIGLLALAYVMVFATQIVHAVGFGSINYRYLLPVLLPITLFMAYGLLEFDKLKGQLVALAAIAMAGVTWLGIKVSPTVENLPDSIEAWGPAIGKIYKAGLENDVPVMFSRGLVFMFVVGAILLPIALFFISKWQRQTK